MIVSGIGYDSHKLVEGRDLVIGGVKIPFAKGMQGHSDADVLIHAIIDSILGATGSVDIGTIFPNTDIKYKNISSIELLKLVKNMFNPKIVYIDCVIIIEKPKLASFIPLMKQNVAKVLDLNSNRVNIKAKTNEGLGFVGEGKGVISYCVCTLDRDF